MDMSETDEAALGRATMTKASWRILPLIAVGYGIAYMDRINISFAAAKMNEDLHFSAAIYGLGGGLFFLSYALFEVPSNMLLARFGARRWIARIMVTWGILAVAMMFVRTPIQFYSVRFLLGLAEAGFFPGVVFYLGQWFPAAYRSRAISRFYVALPVSQIVMGALAGVLLGLHGRLGLAGWQWLFLVEGLPAVIVGVVILFLLPDKPGDVNWLSAAQKGWIETQLARDAAFAGHQDHNFWKALTHPVVLMLGAINFLYLGAFYAFNLSAPMLLGQAAHLNPAQAGYLIAAGGVAGAVAMIAAGWHSDLRNERYLHLTFAAIAAAACYGLMAHTSIPILVMGAYVALVCFNNVTNAVFWTVPGQLLPAASAAVSLAAINSIGQMGSFFAPYAWGLAKDATGSFQLGLSLLPVPFLIGAAIFLYMRARRPLAVSPALAVSSA